MSVHAPIFPVLVAAVGGGLVALTVRETVRAAPGLGQWLTGAIEPLRRAGSEGYAPTDAERRRLGALGAIALLLVGTWLAGPLPAVPLAIAGPASVSWALAARTGRYRIAVERDLPAVAIATADTLAAGRSARAALASARAAVEGPAAVELARVSADLDLGAPLDAALIGLRRRTRSPRVDAFCAALLSQRIAGGDLVAVLRRFAAATAARQRVEADARAATAQARFTGVLVVAMPVGAALFAELVAPGFATGLLAHPVSLALLGASLALQVAGFVVIRKLGQVAGP